MKEVKDEAEHGWAEAVAEASDPCDHSLHQTLQSKHSTFKLTCSAVLFAKWYVISEQ
jgi:hypothetical protein